MIDRRSFIGTLAGGLLATPLAATGQQPPNIPRIGFLRSGSLSTYATQVVAFRQGLRDLGYVEGQNVVIEFRWAEWRLERLPVLAAELVRLKVDVILTHGTPGPLAAKQATTTIPIVIAIVANPAGSGLVASLARPGGNITGLSLLWPELGGKRLQLLREVAPRVTRVAILWNAANPGIAATVRETEAAARTLGVQLQSLEVRGLDDFESAFAAATRERAGALVTVEDPLTFTNRTRIVDFAAKGRLPAVYPNKEYVDDGGLMSYGANFGDLFRRAATYVDKILKGAKLGDLPVEQPTKFALVINLKTAKALGLTIPQSLLGRADEIIQ